MDRFSFDAAATLARIREQGGASILPTLPTDADARCQSVGGVGTVGAPSAEEKTQAAAIIDAAERFQRRGRRA